MNTDTTDTTDTTAYLLNSPLGEKLGRLYEKSRKEGHLQLDDQSITVTPPCEQCGTCPNECVVQLGLLKEVK